MNGRWSNASVNVFLASVLVSVCLASGSNIQRINATLDSIFRSISLACSDTRVQWSIALCAAVYLVTFTVMESQIVAEHRKRKYRTAVWLTVTLLIAGASYALNYSTASLTTKALTLMVGVALGKGATAWVKGAARSYKIEWFSTGITCMLVVIIAVMSVLCLWCPVAFNILDYHHCTRWSGPWNNPNIAGLLMGVGIILAAGIGMRGWNAGNGRCTKVLLVGLCSFVIIVMGHMLLDSYSRGAWVATICGIAFVISEFGVRHVESVCISWLKRNWFRISIILLSVFVLVFWQFRHSNQDVIADRAFSAGDVNDFSWRNRISAWEGALQIVAEHPWFGSGWKFPELLYDRYYLPPKLNEGGAIETNDYLMLSAMLGIPALICFGMYIWLSLARKGESAERGKQKPEPGATCYPPLEFMPPVARQMSPQVICRAGAIVLAVGFWFDGGLFKLATASVFWILLELGREDLPQTA